MPEMSTRRTKPPFDPNSMLWTVMYQAFGHLKPYCPEYTAITHRETRGLLADLKARFPRERFCLVEAKDEHMTREQGQMALRALFEEGARPELAKAADNANMAEVALLAPLAFAEVKYQARLDAWEKANDARRAAGKPLIPKPQPEKRPDVQTRNGRVVIHLGGARL